jgi:hypothetical protein
MKTCPDCHAGGAWQSGLSFCIGQIRSRFLPALRLTGLPLTAKNQTLRADG